jgi:chromosomal replication initiator protein
MAGTNIWEQVLACIETKVNRHSFLTWFKPTTFVADGDTITVCVPNPLFRDWLTKHYAAVIDEALTDAGRKDTKLEFVVSGAPDAAGPTSVTPPLEDPPVPPDLPPITNPAGLNPRYTFDTFIVGPSNQFAHAASRAVAEAPSRSYNPLFIYGGVGLGKTHLMHAIGHYVLANSRGMKLTYISSERFMNEMINAVRYDKILDFRERYRSVDILLVDDIQFLAGKEGTQTEFFHTFNSLYDAQRQIVVTSDRPPKEIPGLEERLVSRFEWGLVTDIRPPDLETRVAILRKKADDDDIVIHDDVLEFIARYCRSSVRELEGAIIKLLAYSSLTHREVTTDLAREALAGQLADAASMSQRSPEMIRQRVAEEFKVTVDGLTSKRRTKDLTVPRQVAMYLMRELLDLPLVEIGKHFGGRDHSTVIHSIQKVEQDMKDRDAFRQKVERLRTEFADVPPPF